MPWQSYQLWAFEYTSFHTLYAHFWTLSLLSVGDFKKFTSYTSIYISIFKDNNTLDCHTLLFRFFVSLFLNNMVLTPESREILQQLSTYLNVSYLEQYEWDAYSVFYILRYLIDTFTCISYSIIERSWIAQRSNPTPILFEYKEAFIRALFDWIQKTSNDVLSSFFLYD